MSYFHCGNGYHHRDGCNGYVGPLDGHTCLCACHGEWDEQGCRTLTESLEQMRRGEGAVLVPRPTDAELTDRQEAKP